MLHLNGVIGAVNLLAGSHHHTSKGNGGRYSRSYSKSDDYLTSGTQQLILRHECLEPLAELQTNFQVILLSFYSQELTQRIVTYLLDCAGKSANACRKIHFDGVYCTQPCF